jgi:hypothetical protein
MYSVGDMVSYRKSINFHDNRNYVGIIKEVGHNGFSHWYKVDWLNVKDALMNMALAEDKISPYEANK